MVLLFGSSAVAVANPLEAPGAVVYVERCAACHDRGDKQGGPALAALRLMSAAQVKHALTRGKMRQQAQGLSRTQRQALVQYLTGSEGKRYAVADAALCRDQTIDTTNPAVASWGLDANSTRLQARSELRSDNVAQLQLQWVFALPQVSEVRSQPVVTTDTVFALAVSGHVFALDRATGCVKWHADLERTLRTSLTLGTVAGEPALFMGDAAATVLALSAQDGRTLWRHDAALFDTSVTTGAPVQAGSRLIVPLSSFDVAAATNPQFPCCKGHGAVLALDVDSGERLWVRHMTPAATPRDLSSAGVQQWGPSGVPVWSTPTVDVRNGRVYVGTGENTSSPPTDLSDSVVALDLASGEIIWRFQATAGDAFNMACGRRAGPNCPKENGPDFDFGASIIRAEDASGAGVLFAGQKSGVVHALRARDGAVLWQRKLSEGTALGGVHWGMALAGERLFVPVADPEFGRPGYVPKPGLYALQAATGQVLWSYRAQRGCELDPSDTSARDNPWPPCPYAYGFSAAPMAANDIVVAGSLDGKVRVFDAISGTVRWQYQTAQAFTAVNNVPAHGGAIDNGGVLLADDMLLVSSGYGMFGQMPGNALMAFALPHVADVPPASAP
ncbi:MAG: PQQ-binding-like beta-propeller repeat protein [Pseudomonadales bacterium]